MVTWTLEKLRAHTAQQRHELWQNAKSKTAQNAEAVTLVEMIESSGLDYLAGKRPSVSIYDAIGRRMRKVIFTPEGERAALKAQESGLPPLAGLDPLLSAELGADYSRGNEATVQAGYLVTDLMKQLGFEKMAGKSKKLPAGCVATTGLMFKRANSGRQ